MTPVQVQPVSIPAQVQVTTMSTQPVTAQATITTPVNDKTNLRGKQPPTFDGTRSKADNFWRAFKIYLLRFPPFPTFLPADRDTLDDYGTALTHGILPGIPF